MTSTLVCLVLGSTSLAGEPAPAPDAFAPALVSPPALLNLAAALAQPEAPGKPEADAEPPPEARTRIPYGRAGSEWLTLGGGFASDGGDSNDFLVNFAWSRFLADSLEFGLEAGGWWFDQQGDDTGGASASLLLRWHFLHDDDYSWTVFGDFGMGMLGAFDLVPDRGTGFNFLPRAGVGATFDLDDDPGDGPRWMIGLRYHHISNGRIEGDQRNPGRDGVMIYAAIVFPF